MPGTNWWQPDGWRVEQLGKKGKRIQQQKSVVTKQSQGLKYKIGNIANNIIVTMYGFGWVFELLGDPFVNSITV